MAFPWVVSSTGPGGFVIYVFILWRKLPKAQPKVVTLSSWCLVVVERLFLAVPRGCLQFVIVVFPDHTHLLLWRSRESNLRPPVYKTYRFIPFTTEKSVIMCFCGRVHWLYQYWPELPKAQPVVVLVLQRLRRRGNGLKSHPTDWEKPWIEPATPGLQDIGLSPTPRRLLKSVIMNEVFYCSWRQYIYSSLSNKIILKLTIE